MKDKEARKALYLLKERVELLELSNSIYPKKRPQLGFNGNPYNSHYWGSQIAPMPVSLKSVVLAMLTHFNLRAVELEPEIKEGFVLEESKKDV